MSALFCFIRRDRLLCALFKRYGMRERLVNQFQKAEGVTEDLKRRDQMTWVGAMNSIYNRVDEIILHDLIYS